MDKETLVNKYCPFSNNNCKGSQCAMYIEEEVFTYVCGKGTVKYKCRCGLCQ